jgi:hypothetical protein
MIQGKRRARKMLRRWQKSNRPLLLPEMPAATRAVRTTTNLLTATPEEAALVIACALADPRDLLHLAVALPRHFATRCIAARSPPAHRTTASGGSGTLIADEVPEIEPQAEPQGSPDPFALAEKEKAEDREIKQQEDFDCFDTMWEKLERKGWQTTQHGAKQRTHWLLPRGVECDLEVRDHTYIKQLKAKDGSMRGVYRTRSEVLEPVAPRARRHRSTGHRDVVDHTGGGTPMDRWLYRPGARLGAAPRSGELAGPDVGGAVAASCGSVRSVARAYHAV